MAEQEAPAPVDAKTEPGKDLAALAEDFAARAAAAQLEHDQREADRLANLNIAELTNYATMEE